jgi:phosphoglycolate phosphatase-like HAD superfamily hydrolase
MQWKIELMPYASETLISLSNKNYRIWIASGACREFIDKFIHYFNLEKIIVASTSANEIKNKKPHPDVFLATFKKIEHIHGVPDERYVIGDWWSDVEWWYKAWAKTIWLNYWKNIKLNDQYCNFEIESLQDISNIL